MICTTERIGHGQLQWVKNGAVVMNGTTHTIAGYVMNATIGSYTNTLTVTGEEHESQNISCIVNHGSDKFSETLIIEGLEMVFLLCDPHYRSPLLSSSGTPPECEGNDFVPFQY